MTKKVTIAAATGYAGAAAGLSGPAIEAAMNEAAVACHALGIMDDASPERVAELTGEPVGPNGSEYIRAAKLEARQAIKAAHREAMAAHEAEMAARAAE